MHAATGRSKYLVATACTYLAIKGTRNRFRQALIGMVCCFLDVARAALAALVGCLVGRWFVGEATQALVWYSDVQAAFLIRAAGLQEGTVIGDY